MTDAVGRTETERRALRKSIAAEVVSSVNNRLWFGCHSKNSWTGFGGEWDGIEARAACRSAMAAVKKAMREWKKRK